MTRVSIVVAVLAANSFPALAGTVENGKRIAVRWCSSCHVVAPDQERASTDVPAFMSLGKQGNFTAERLALTLLEPHPAMPKLSLSRQEISDLAAYINSWSVHGPNPRRSGSAED